jgi:hypothetical protein
MLNCNHFVVSQTNPHIAPLLNFKASLNNNTLARLAELELKHRWVEEEGGAGAGTAWGPAAAGGTGGAASCRYCGSCSCRAAPAPSLALLGWRLLVDGSRPRARSLTPAPTFLLTHSCCLTSPRPFNPPPFPQV